MVGRASKHLWGFFPLGAEKILEDYYLSPKLSPQGHPLFSAEVVQLYLLQKPPSMSLAYVVVLFWMTMDFTKRVALALKIKNLKKKLPFGNVETVNGCEAWPHLV